MDDLEWKKDKMRRVAQEAARYEADVFGGLGGQPATPALRPDDFQRMPGIKDRESVTSTIGRQLPPVPSGDIQATNDASNEALLEQYPKLRLEQEKEARYQPPPAIEGLAAGIKEFGSGAFDAFDTAAAPLTYAG